MYSIFSISAFSEINPKITPKLPYTFNIDKDLLLLNFDLKTDVDDVHTVAALDLILKSGPFKHLNYFAISGTYGVQSGLYVPANHLFDLIFKQNWTDAHMQRQQAINDTSDRIASNLASGGHVWVMEAGQSDFTQQLMQHLANSGNPVPKNKMVVVQHSDWNEKETSQGALAFVKQHITYVKVPDGNASANGTPDFNNAQFKVKNLENNQLPSADAWHDANKVSRQYKGTNGRYRNDAIDNGRADFSDLVEVVWILGITDVDTLEAFFEKFNTKP